MGVTQLVDLVVVGFLQLLATVATPQGRQHLATKKLFRNVWLGGHSVGQNEKLVSVTSITVTSRDLRICISWRGNCPGSCQYRHPILYQAYWFFAGAFSMLSPASPAGRRTCAWHQLLPCMTSNPQGQPLDHLRCTHHESMQYDSDGYYL